MLANVKTRMFPDVSGVPGRGGAAAAAAGGRGLVCPQVARPKMLSVALTVMLLNTCPTAGPGMPNAAIAKVKVLTIVGEREWHSSNPDILRANRG